MAFVLMAGGFSPPPLAVAAGCSVLDMHLSTRETVLGRWQAAIGPLDRAGVTRERLCLCGGSTALPRGTTGLLRTIVDSHDYRGPAGALRDACERLPPDCFIIAAEAARCCTAQLHELLAHHRRSGVEATVARNPDESPAGLYVLSRAVLDEVPHAGFMDLKEQLLRRLIGLGRRVGVCDLAGHGSLRLRTRADFLRAVRAVAGPGGEAEPAGLEPRVLRRRTCAASVVCEDADVAPDAIVVDSVVLPGAVVGRGALLARSIVGPGCVVGPGAKVIDAVVGPSGVTHDDEVTGEGSR